MGMMETSESYRSEWSSMTGRAKSDVYVPKALRPTPADTPLLSQTQLHMLQRATWPGSEAKVYGIHRSRKSSFEALFRAGLIEYPSWGSPLTADGIDVARRIKYNPRSCRYFVDDSPAFGE